jgi:hypothetical protein
MPYDIRLPDGTLVNNIPDDIDPVAAKAKLLEAYPDLALGEKRTWGEAATDVAASFGKGLGSLAQIPGQVYGLVTGDVQPNEGLQGLGKKFEAYSESFKSPVLKAKEAERQKKISQAEGFFDEAGTAIGQTIKDPALLTSFFAEQIPNLFGAGGGGIITKTGAKLLFRDATEAALSKAGTYGARATEAAMQGADIGSDTYEKVYDARIKQGATQEEAQKDALLAGRTAAIEAGAITFGTSFGAGSTIERALTRSVADTTKHGIIRGTLGELASEAAEEGGGQLVSNLQLQKVAPETDIMQGVGAAAGLGAMGGALFGLPASFVNKANAAELERAKKLVEDAKKRAAENNKPEEVQLQIGYDPNVEGSGIYTPIIVNPDGTTTFPSEKNQFAQVVPNELSEEGMAEKYGIPTTEQLKERTFYADTIKSFGISPKANIYKKQDLLGVDIADPAQAAKVKAELEGYLKKYPNANPKIRQNIMNYLARPEFQPKPVAPTQITEASVTPQADQDIAKQRLIDGFKNRPEIKKIYEDYDKMMAAKDADKAALSAFNNVVTPETLKSLGFHPASALYQDPEVVNADLTNPETADQIRAKLLAIQSQTRSKTLKDNIEKYLNRSEFITPRFVEDYLNPPRTENEQGLDHFIFTDADGNIQSKYGTIYEKNGKKYVKYPENKGQKGGERELNENVAVNPNPDQIELMSLYKAKENLMKEPDDFKQWLMTYGVDSKERNDMGIETRIPNRMFRDDGFGLDDLVLAAINDGILTEGDFDMNRTAGGVEQMKEYIKRALAGEFVPTLNNTRNMMDLEHLQSRIDNLEDKVKGVPEEVVAEQVTEEKPEIPNASKATMESAAQVKEKAIEQGIKKFTEALERHGIDPYKSWMDSPARTYNALEKIQDNIESSLEKAGFSAVIKNGSSEVRDIFQRQIEPKARENIRNKQNVSKENLEASKSTMEAKESTEIPPVFVQNSNPGGNWLKHKRELAESYGRKEGGVPSVFGSTTMYFTKGQATNSEKRTLLIPVDVLARLQGINNEQQNVRQKDLEGIKNKMSETGRLPQTKDGKDYAPFINVYQDGTPYVNEGNHRIMAAKALGFKYIPVQIDYFNGAELENGVLTPKKAIEYDRKAHQEGFTLDNYSNKKPFEAQAAKATMEEKKVADRLAEMKNGTVIYQDGNLVLIRSFNKNGQSIYFPAKNGTVAMVDIDRFTGDWISEADKKKLKELKRKLEDANAKAQNDLVQFDKDGVSLSKDIDPKMAGLIAEWKKLFKLNQRIYVSTFEDAIANKDQFVGPFTRIGTMAARSRTDNGITANLANGDRVILFTKSTSKAKMLETLAHEMGHAHQQEVYENASPEIKKQIKSEYEKWLTSQKGKSAKELLHALRSKKVAETTKVKDGIRAEDLDNYNEYWTSFSEWYADQVARWATTSEKPLSVVDRFFSKIANGLRKIFSMLKNQGYLPNETFKAYMDYITTPEAVKNNPIKPMSIEDQEPLFSRATMKASFEGVDEAYAEAIKKQFAQEEATVGEKFENLKDNFFEKMVTGLFDEFRAIKKYSIEGYMMARLSKSIDGGLQGLLEHGQVFINDGALDIRPGTKGLLEILAPLGKEVDQYQIWKALNRDAQMPADKRSFDAALIAGRDKLAQGTIDGKSRKEIYEKARDEENKLNKSVLDVALESGLIDRQAYQVFSNDINYIPFYKMMEDGDVNSVNASSKLTGQYFSKALKGGEKKTNDLMENVLLNWSHILSASMKNQAAFKTIQAAESMGAAVKAKPMDGKYPPNTIKVMEAGKTVHYTLEDADLVDAISTISYLGPKSAFLNIAKGFTNALRYGVTLSPAYKVRNLIRDSLQSASVSELGANMFENVYNGLKMTKKGDPTFMSALAGGGIFEMGTAHEGDQAKLIKRLIDKGVKEATILDTPEKIKGKLQDLLDSYNELGNKFENANRLALYKKLRDSGKSHLEASYSARDLMDFSMQGQFRAVKVIGSCVPFFNARLQGLYKLGRDGITPTYRVICNATTGKPLQIGDKEKAQRFMVMASAIALASMALYGMYKDDEDFQRREDWDRDNFWWFKIGETQFRIPKPFEIGAFGTVAERTYEQIVDENVEGKVFGQRMNAILMDTFSLNPVPQMMKPLIDLYANKDSFTGAPIESAGMERLSKQERQNDKTSGVAIALGGISAGAHKIMTFNPDAEGLSPVQMDYAIKAYLGWLGATAVSTADRAVEPFQEGTKVHPPIIDQVALGFIKTEPQTQSKYMTQFYQNNARLQSALADMRHYAELGEMDKVTQILEEKGDDIALSKVYDKTTKQLAELRKQSRRIEQSKDMSSEDKRAEMNRLKILMSDMAREMEQIRKTR